MLEKIPHIVGHALKYQRAGLEKTAFQQLDLREGTGALQLSSLAFGDHAPMPSRYTADGEGLSPPLHWSGVPAQAGSLVLIVEDADAPMPNPLVQVIVVGLDAENEGLSEGALSNPDPRVRTGLRTGRNSYLRRNWLAPDPPPGHGQHRYAFQLFALLGEPAYSPAPGRAEVMDVLRLHGVASGCLIGTYERDNRRKLGTTAKQESMALSA